MRKLFFLLLLVMTTLAVAPLSLSAQTSQGILVGVTRDSTGAVVQNAHVSITNQDTGELRTTVTKSDGTYRLEAIPPGRYTIKIEVPGFDTAKATGIVVNPSVVSSYDAVLRIGKANETVEVAAVSNSINTENGQLTGMINANDIRQLPLFSLNPIELAGNVARNPGYYAAVFGSRSGRDRSSPPTAPAPVPTTF